MIFSSVVTSELYTSFTGVSVRFDCIKGIKTSEISYSTEHFWDKDLKKKKKSSKQLVRMFLQHENVKSTAFLFVMLP